MARERTDITPSLLGSVLLHGGLVLATLISWPWGSPMRMEASVPVTLVAQAPVSNIRPAEQAPEEAPAMTEEPVPAETPEPAAPPAPEALVVQNAPPPKAAPKKPAVQPKPALDLDALADSLRPSRPAKPKSSAAKGKARVETAAQARVAVGQASAMAAAALSDLGADLGRRWNPNCEVEGGADVDIRVAFRLDQAGRVVRRQDADGRLVPEFESSGDKSRDPVVRAASDRAKRAIGQAEPFENLPAELYGDRIIVRFNARNACATG